MDILKGEIAKKRKLLEEKNVLDSNKRYFRRGDLLAREKEEYCQKYGMKNDENLFNSRKISEGNKSDSEVEAHNILPRNEVISRLRHCSEPILLFGETEIDVFKRLCKCELLEPEVIKGFRNDFQEAMEQVDQAHLNELLTSSGDAKNTSKSIDDERPAFSLSYDEIIEMAKNMGSGERERDMTITVHFIQFILHKWHEQLQNCSPEEKAGTKGKLAEATYIQTKEYLKPLLRKLKSFTLPEDISGSLTEIIVHLLNRNYLKANDSYLQMAIGNAPWPIGVTMVGIHARTGREKIFSKNVAHVMNNDVQRKYLQRLKTLMTKCQEFYPTDPSRCVEYAAST